MNKAGLITREELITSDEYLLSNIQYELYNDIKQYLEKNHMSQTEFAVKLNVSKGYVSQILNGNFDHKLSKLIRLYKSLGMVILGLEKVEIRAYLEADKTKFETLELRPVKLEPKHSEEDDLSGDDHEDVKQKVAYDEERYYQGYTGPGAPISISA